MSAQTLINENGTSLANFYGSTGSASGGVFNMSAEGQRICKTVLSSGDLWMRTSIVNNPATHNHVINFSSDGSPNGNTLGAIISSNGTHVTLDHLIAYTGFTGYNGDSSGTAVDGGTAWSANLVVGLTFARSTKIVRIWTGASLAAMPTSVSVWSSGAGGSGFDFHTFTSPYIDYGNFVGFGSQSNGTDPQFGPFTAGDFLGGGGGRTLFLPSGLDGLSTSGPKQFNPLQYHRTPDIALRRAS